MAAEDQHQTVDRPSVTALCLSALTRAGASTHTAEVLTQAALFAEDHGFGSVGLSHVLDFLSAMKEGRLDGRALPEVSWAAPSLLVANARGGVFHTGFEVAFDRLTGGARANGVTVLVQHGAYAGGQLGWFTDRVAREGLLSLATITSSPLLSTGPGVGRVFGTNPMAFSVPRETEPPITVDQASSVTAMASVGEAADRGDVLPEGWTIDADLQPTINPSAALAGAVLPFGGYKGANMAWFVELFSSMAGGSWSLDAPSAWDGARSPSVGMFMLAVNPAAVDPTYARRVEEHVSRLANLGVRGPGIRRLSDPAAPIRVRSQVLEALRSF